MILDEIDYWKTYLALHPYFRDAFLYLTGSPPLEPGRYELEPAHTYALVQQYKTQPDEGNLFEAHREYIDIQYLLEGEETIYYAPVTQLSAGTYDAEKDWQTLSGEGQALTLRARQFAIFFPQDAHRPGKAAGTITPVKKIVIKVPA